MAGGADANMFNGRGYAYMRSGRISEALEDFKQAVKLAPKAGNLQHSLGEGYFNTGDREKKMGAFKRACELAKKSEVKSWQGMLKKAGHFSKEPDGICGSVMLDAFVSCAKPRCDF